MDISQVPESKSDPKVELECKSKKKKKDPNRVKRPTKGFALYIKEHSGNSTIEGVDYKGKPKDKMKAIGAKWRKLTAEEKKKY